MVFFFPGCVSVRDAEATGCCTNPVIPSIPSWARPGPVWAVEQCTGRIRIGTPRSGPVWDEPHHPTHHPEERGGVDIGAVEANREVERTGGGGHDVAAPHVGAGSDERSGDEAVGGAKPTRVVDAHEKIAGDHAGEPDDTVGSRSHEISVAGGVLDAPIPRPVGPFGQAERIEDRRLGRRREPRRGGAGRLRDRQHEDDCDNRGLDTGHTTPL